MVHMSYFTGWEDDDFLVSRKGGGSQGGDDRPSRSFAQGGGMDDEMGE